MHYVKQTQNLSNLGKSNKTIIEPDDSDEQNKKTNKTRKLSKQFSSKLSQSATMQLYSK